MLTLPDRYKFDKNNNVFFVLDKELISVPLVYTCRKVSKDMLENDFKTTLQFCQFFFINGQNGWIIWTANLNIIFKLPSSCFHSI